MPADLSAFASQFPPEVIQAVGAIFASKPEQEETFLRDYAGDLGKWLQSFEGFWTNPANTANVNPADYGVETALLGALGYVPNPAAPQNAAAAVTPNNTGGGTPIEAALFNNAAPGLVAQSAADVGRQAQVADLTKQTNAAYGNLATVLGQGTQRFDGQAYFAANPGVAGLFNQSNNGTAPGTKSIQTVDGKIVDMTPDQFAEYYHTTWGANQGLKPTYTSDLTQSQLGNNALTAGALNTAAQTSATAQLGALKTSIDQMQGNLTGNLAAKAAALSTAVASYTANLDQLDASQKAALAQQIATQQQDLETSIAAQKSALSTLIDQLKGNSSTAAQAKLAALATEVDALTAAEAPMAQARIQAAEGLTTSINLGLESTKDQLTAESARNGFVGGSTMQDAALARAVVGARQDAANVRGGALVANASDLRDVNRYGAHGKYSIANALAGQQQQIGDSGAMSGAQLAAALAQGTQAIGDTGAAGLRTISDTTAGARAGIGNNAATQTYNDVTGGANAAYNLANALSTGTYNVNTTLAQQQQAAATAQAGADAAARAALPSQSANAAAALVGLPASQAAALTALIPYGNAGTTNAQNVLQWWANPTAPPNPTTTIIQPGNQGNQVSQFGAGLTSAGFDWLKYYATPKPTTTVGAGAGSGAGGAGAVGTDH